MDIGKSESDCRYVYCRSCAGSGNTRISFGCKMQKNVFLTWLSGQ